MDAIAQDVAHALRSLAKAPRFTVVVVVTLALGIGANSAIFSVVSAVLLRPLPFPDARRVVDLAWDGGTHIQSSLTAVRFEYWREHAGSLSAVATWRAFHGRVERSGEVVAVTGLRVSRDFLDVVGHEPVVGRGFAPSEDVSGGARVALVSHAMWQTRFDGAVDVLGRTLLLDDEPHTIVGTLPEGFGFPYLDEPVDVIVPLGLTVDPGDEGQDWPTIARLRDGVTRRQAEADVASLLESFRGEYPTQVYEGDRGMILATFSELYVGEAARVLWILLGAVTSVLLIACANVANLFLARATRRRGEVALRAALGATRARVVRLVLAESVLVALAAGLLGLLLARWGVGLLVELTPSQLPRMSSIGVDGRVVLFTFVAALATGVLFGGAAALPAARTGLSKVLNEGGRGGSGRGRGRQGLLVLQSALSMVLLVGAGLLSMTLIGLARVDAGFDRDGLFAARLPVRPAGYETSNDLWELERRVADRLSASAAVASIAGATNLPLERGVNIPVTVADRADGFAGTVEWRAVTPGYFGTLGVAVVAGRAFTDTDTEAGPLVAVVNEAFARAYFPEGSPLGRRIDIGRYRDRILDAAVTSRGVEIVGVVADIREVSLRADPRRTVYVAQTQASSALSRVLGTMPVFIARGRPGARDVERALGEALRAADPSLPGPEVFPLGVVVARSLARERFGTVLLSAFAALALALTAFGVYGVLEYTVRQRQREIGIRMALGAGRPDVTRVVLGHVIGPVVVGLLLGVGVALSLSRVVAGYLWGVAPTDPTTLAAVATILLAVALAASWAPAREAVGLDPAATLNRS